MRDWSKDQQIEWLQKAEGDEMSLEEDQARRQVLLALAGPVVRGEELSAELCNQARNSHCLYLSLSALIKSLDSLATSGPHEAYAGLKFWIHLV